MDLVERKLSHITTIKKATAYYELKRLEQQGLVSVRLEQDEGRPPRRVYALTAAGEQAFGELLCENLQEAAPPLAPTDIGLMFLDRLPPAEACSVLEARLAGLKAQVDSYRQAPSHGACSSVDQAIRHVSVRLQAEIDSIANLIAQIKERDRG